MNQGDKTKPVCPYCNSDDVVCDALGTWNADTQKWEIHATYDNSYCQSCDSDIKSLNWVEHNG